MVVVAVVVVVVVVVVSECAFKCVYVHCTNNASSATEAN